MVQWGMCCSRRCIALFFLCVCLFVAGCFAKVEDEPAAVFSPDEMFGKARNLYDQGHFREAGDQFIALEGRYPFSDQARSATLFAARAYYEGEDYARAVEAAGRYADLYVSASDRDEALYLAGLASKTRLKGVSRDQSGAREALSFFQSLLHDYPDSPYVHEARSAILELRDRLALKELKIAYYYLDRGEHLAALNRFGRVAFLYQETPSAQEALLRTVELSVSMGLFSEARDSTLVLRKRYPHSSWREAADRLLHLHGLELEGSGERSGLPGSSGEGSAESAGADYHP